MKKILAIALAATLSLSLVACGGGAKKEEETKAPAADTTEVAMDATKDDAAATGDEKTAALMLYNGNDTYISSVAAAIETASAGKFKVDRYDGKNDAAVQSDQTDTLAANKVDVVMVNLADVQTADAVAGKLQAAEVPFVFFNREPDKSVMEKYNTIFIGTTASEAGVMQGDLLADYYEAHPEMDLNGDGKIQYLMFQGEPGNPEAIARTEFSVKQAETRGLTMDDIAGEPYVCNWDAAKANESMTAALASYEGKIEAVICNNDGMAEGVISALNSVDFNTGDKAANYIPVIGVDATDAAVELINKGKMEATVKQDGEAMGNAVVALAANIVAGKEPLEGTEYTLADDGVSIRIPYSSFKGQ